mgnify:CR=1 FL=1
MVRIQQIESIDKLLYHTHWAEQSKWRNNILEHQDSTATYLPSFDNVSSDFHFFQSLFSFSLSRFQSFCWSIDSFLLFLWSVFLLWEVFLSVSVSRQADIYVYGYRSVTILIKAISKIKQRTEISYHMNKYTMRQYYMYDASPVRRLLLYSL